jgi:hypothetical protein
MIPRSAIMPGRHVRLLAKKSAAERSVPSRRRCTNQRMTYVFLSADEAVGSAGPAIQGDANDPALSDPSIMTLLKPRLVVRRRIDLGPQEAVEGGDDVSVVEVGDVGLDVVERDRRT